MRFAPLHILEGRTEEPQRAVTEEVTRAPVDALGAAQGNVPVWTHDATKESWGIAAASAKNLRRCVGRHLSPGSIVHNQGSSS